MPPDIGEFSRVIQLALAPAFLLSGIAALLNVMTARPGAATAPHQRRDPLHHDRGAARVRRGRGPLHRSRAAGAEEEAPAPSHDAAGAVAGFNEAVASVLDDIVEWADREAAARSAR